MDITTPVKEFKLTEKELNDLILLVQYEQSFRCKLHLYKELEEFRLK